MSEDNPPEKRDELHELIGALDILTLLREEMEQWLEEAQDASKQETLENVVGHLAVMEEEYHRRRRMLGDE
ncbi:MAG: hypothetical protein WCH04_19555 [Gammaproteobacteria bacterium]|jgi:hypothetical protein